MSDLYLLDTNGASDLFSGKSTVHVRAAMKARQRGDLIAISVLTHAELSFGFAQNPLATRLRRAYGEFLSQAVVLAWEERAAESYAQLRLELKRRGLVVDTIDLLIASQAHALGATLVTGDEDFRHVADLIRIVNWATELN